MQLFLELASGGTGVGGETRGVSMYTGSTGGPLRAPAPHGRAVPPVAQLLRCLDSAFPAGSPGFAEVCAPIRKSRDGGEGRGSWRAKRWGPHFEQSIFFLPPD